MVRRRPAGPRPSFVGICGGVTDGIAYARTRAAAHPGRGCVDVPCRPEDRHPVGEGGQAQRDPHARRAPSLPGVGSTSPAAGADSPAAPRRIGEADPGRFGRERGRGAPRPRRRYLPSGALHPSSRAGLRRASHPQDLTQAQATVGGRLGDDARHHQYGEEGRQEARCGDIHSGRYGRAGRESREPQSGRQQPW